MPASASAPHTLPFNYCHVEREIITLAAKLFSTPAQRERRKLAVNYLEAMLYMRRIYRMSAEVVSLFNVFVGER
jgi:hypothetical protein